MSKQVLVLNGPNLGRLGRREPQIYGTTTHDDLVARLIEYGRELGLDVEVRQTDSEERMMGWIHQAADDRTPIVINPAAWSHYNIAIADALAQLGRLVLRYTSLTSPPGRSSVTTAWCRRMSPGRSSGWD